MSVSIDALTRHPLQYPVNAGISPTTMSRLIVRGGIGFLFLPKALYKSSRNILLPVLLLLSLFKINSTTLYFVEALANPSSPPQLDNIFLSHGYIEFDSAVKEYTIPLSAHFQTLQVVPVLPRHVARTDHPLVYVGLGALGSMEKVVSGIGTSLDISAYSGRTFTVIIEVTDPQNTGLSSRIKLYFDESNAVPTTALETISFVDQDGDRLETSGTLTAEVPRDQQSYLVYSQPKTQTMSVSGKCEDGSTLVVNGSSSGTITREVEKADQLVTVECRQQWGEKVYFRTYFFDVRTQMSGLPPPKSLVVVDSGKGCKLTSADDEEPTRFVCESDTSTASFLATVDPRFRYSIVNRDGTVKIRLLNNEPTAPVPLNSGLYIHGTAGHDSESQKWPLPMNGVFFPEGGSTIMQVIGWLLGSAVLLSAPVLLVVLGVANVVGVGTPFGASEVPSTLIFLLQYFCFANAVRGSPTVLADMTTVLKYVTLWCPLPWAEAGEVSVAHLENAEGCLFWCLVLFAGVCLLHGLVWIKFRVMENGFTYPHKMLFGNWESRAVHFVIFPVTVASSMLFVHPNSSVGQRVLGTLTFAGIVAWMAVSFFVVKRTVKSRKVVWVWSQSLREDDNQIEAGFWADAECDQLYTEPTNRSFCRTLFPWRWVSTVADIEPVSIMGSGARLPDTSAGSLASTQHEEEQDASDSGPSPFLEGFKSYGDVGGDICQVGKTPRNVEIRTTRAPSKLSCTGQKLVAGLFRSQWLDILFTYESLTNLCAYAEKHGVRTQIPLTIKTHQLTGPLSGGYLCFYFNGIRIPFVRPGEFTFRVVLGLMLGAVLASSLSWVDALCFFLVGVFATAAVFYSLASQPFCRRAENWLLTGMLATVALSAPGFMGLALAARPSFVLDMLLWLMMLFCMCLSLYSVFITFSIFSAVLCPPLEEFRFLERLCNIDLVLSDHLEGFKTETMAYNRHGTRDIMINCTSHRKTDDLQIEAFPSSEDATIELPVSDVIAACRSGHLPPPKVCLTVTSKHDPLGYIHLNLYDRMNVGSRVSSFIAQETNSALQLQQLTNFIQRQIDTRLNDTAVIALTVILPKLSSSSSKSWVNSRGVSVTYTDGSVSTKHVTPSVTHSGHSVENRSSHRGYSRISGEDGTAGYTGGGTRGFTMPRSRMTTYSHQVEMRSH